MKTCSKCGAVKPQSDFGKHARQKDGLQRNCKECQRGYFRKYYADNKEVLAPRRAEYVRENIDAIYARVKEYKERDPERYTQYSRDYRARNPEKRKETCDTYRKNNLARARIYRRIYTSKNKDKLAAKSSLRRAVKLMATPSWIDHDAVAEIYALAMRVTADARVPYHVDHIVPLISDTVCGLHWEGNLRVIPGSENQSKSNRHWPHQP